MLTIQQARLRIREATPLERVALCLVVVAVGVVAYVIITTGQLPDLTLR